MPEYIVIAEFEDAEAGVRRKAGESIQIDEQRANVLANIGVIVLDTPDENGLVNLGGGYYQLPNGDKIRGKQKAIEALEQLKQNAVETSDQEKAGGEVGA